MLIATAATVLALANPATAEVAYVPLKQGRDAAAIEILGFDVDAEQQDPAKLINLGVAYARQGRKAEARAMFEAAMKSSDRLTLETANGEWKDSRHLARLALKLLEQGELRTERMAAR
ncbi:hypothetical protein BPTFM16_01549 [Altererythrobacter insulae]|nr:hypothetical protein BPTFM16_01549 [Altererythrobacter insulae]